jgi:hypothetical protein
MTDAEIGGLMLLAFGLLYATNKMPAIRAVLAFLGTILVGTDGHLTRWLADLVVWMAHTATSLTGWAVGVAVPGALALVAGYFFVHDLMPKHSAGKRTGWAGILLAALILAGVTGFSALSSVPGAVRNGVTSVQQSG